MKKILFGFTVLLALALGSCTSDKSADAGDLIATVPSDASFVATVNLAQLLDKAGCKVDGSKITPSEEVKSVFGNRNSDSKGRSGMQNQAMAEDFYNGKSGIDPTVAVVFKVGYYTYLTGIAADPAQFKASVEKNYGDTFSREGDFDVAGNVALADNQFWVNLDKGAIDEKELAHFRTLSQSQSFASNAYASQLSKISTDLEGWGNIAALLNTAGLSFQDRATAQVTLQLLFEDPADMAFSLNFGKGTAEATATVLNSKGKEAKFLLPAEPVDLKTIDRIGGNADILAAVNVPAKLMKKLKEDTDSKSPSTLGYMLEQLKGIDGTIAFAMTQGTTHGFKAVISTDGQNTAALSALLDNQGATVVKDGNYLVASEGAMEGSTSVSELAKSLKGTVAGVSGSLPENVAPVSLPLKSCSFALRPHGSGMQIELKLALTNDKENFLITALRGK